MTDEATTALGWAVRTPHGLDIRTVGPTRQSAIINWLCAGQHNLEHRMIYVGDSSDKIEGLWREAASSPQAEVVVVNVTEARQ